MNDAGFWKDDSVDKARLMTLIKLDREKKLCCCPLEINIVNSASKGLCQIVVVVSQRVSLLSEVMDEVLLGRGPGIMVTFVSILLTHAWRTSCLPN